MTTCDTIAKSLISSFGSGIEVHSLVDGCVVVTPFLRPNFDHIEFFVDASREKIVVTDEGETVNDLFLQGLDIDAEQPIYDQIVKIAMSHRLQFQDHVLYAETTEQELGDVSLRMLNAMQAASYLVYKLSARPRDKFVNQVETFLLEHKVTYTPQVILRGRTTKNKFAYYINGTRNILLDALSSTTANTTKNSAMKIAYKWIDMREAGSNMNFAVILDNSRSSEIWDESGAMSILRGHSDNVFFWTEREEKLLPLLADKSGKLSKLV